MNNRLFIWAIVGAGVLLAVLLFLMMLVQGGYLRTQVVGQPLETAPTGACYFDVVNLGAAITVCEDSHTKLSCFQTAGTTNVQWHEASVCIDDSSLVPAELGVGETVVP